MKRERLIGIAVGETVAAVATIVFTMALAHFDHSNADKVRACAGELDQIQQQSFRAVGSKVLSACADFADDFDTGPASIDIKTGAALLTLPSGDDIRNNELADAQASDTSDQIAGSTVVGVLLLVGGGIGGIATSDTLTRRRLRAATPAE